MGAVDAPPLGFFKLPVGGTVRRRSTVLVPKSVLFKESEEAECTEMAGRFMHHWRRSEWVNSRVRQPRSMSGSWESPHGENAVTAEEEEKDLDDDPHKAEHHEIPSIHRSWGSFPECHIRNVQRATCLPPRAHKCLYLSKKQHCLGLRLRIPRSTLGDVVPSRRGYGLQGLGPDADPAWISWALDVRYIGVVTHCCLAGSWDDEERL